MSTPTPSPNKETRVVGGWTRDVHVVDSKTMTELEARIRKEMETAYLTKLRDSEKALQHERDLRFKAEDEALAASSAKKSFDELSAAMGEMNQLSSQAAAQVTSAKDKARVAKEEAMHARERAVKAEAAKDEALRRAQESEQAKHRALRAEQNAKETRDRAISQAAVHAEAMAERHALHVQRMKEAMKRDATSSEIALQKSLETAHKRVESVTTSINAAFAEALARLESEHEESMCDLESDREALLLRKAIGQSAFAVLEAETTEKQTKNTKGQAILAKYKKTPTKTKPSLSPSPRHASPTKQNLDESTFKHLHSPTSQLNQSSLTPRHHNGNSPLSSPLPPSPPPTSVSSPKSSPNVVTVGGKTSPAPKGLGRVAAMLAQSENVANAALAGHGVDSNRGLPDTPSPTKLNSVTSKALPPKVLEKIKLSFDAHNKV